jgi:hypothetical protein
MKWLWWREERAEAEELASETRQRLEAVRADDQRIHTETAKSHGFRSKNHFAQLIDDAYGGMPRGTK